MTIAIASSIDNFSSVIISEKEKTISTMLLNNQPSLNKEEIVLSKYFIKKSCP